MAEHYSSLVPKRNDPPRVLISKILQSLVGTGGTTSGGVVTNADYGGATPGFVPVGGAGITIDTSTGKIWYYYSGQWN